MRQLAEGHGYSQQEMLDRMLRPLYDALLLRMAEKWSNDQVSNLHVCHVYELAKWWLLGMNVGSTAIFDAICQETYIGSQRHSWPLVTPPRLQWFVWVG